jgi:hypothetical protein
LLLSGSGCGAGSFLSGIGPTALRFTIVIAAAMRGDRVFDAPLGVLRVAMLGLPDPAMQSPGLGGPI